MAVLQRGDDLVEVAEEGGQVGPEVVQGRVLGRAVAHGQLAGEGVVAALGHVRDVVGGVHLLVGDDTRDVTIPLKESIPVKKLIPSRE